MKTKKYIIFALAVLGLATSCERLEWGAPDNVENGVEAFGNKYIQVTNLKSIAEVKQLYQNEINNNSLKLVKDPMQIRGIVIGNDEGGNIYNSLYIQDHTGAIAISIGQGGLFGPFSRWPGRAHRATGTVCRRLRQAAADRYYLYQPQP